LGKQSLLPIRQLLQTTFGWGELGQNRDVLEQNRDFCWVLGAKWGTFLPVSPEQDFGVSSQ
jgi:hypothetical protein